MLISDTVSTALTMIKFFAIMFGAEMSDNMLAAMNSARCALSSGFENVWMLIMAAYHFTLTFGLQQMVIDWMNWLYPQICTCSEDATNIALMLLYQEASTGMDTARFERFDTCSEAVLEHKLVVKYRSSQ